MIPKFAPHGASIGVVLIAVTVLTVPLPARQAHDAHERFTAFAVDIGPPGRPRVGPPTHPAGAVDVLTAG